MEKDKRLAIFEDYPIPKAVLALVGPSVAGTIVMMLYNLADTFFVGMLGDPVETAAVSLAAPVILAFNAVINLFGVGSGSLMGRSLGERNYDKVKRSSSIAVWGTLLFGLLFSLIVLVLNTPLLHLIGAAEENWESTRRYLFYTALLGAVPSMLNVVLSYLIKTEGSAIHASIGTMSGCILNIILDPIFILPRFIGMGAAGAGLATLISNCVACLYFFVLIISRGDKSFVCVDPRMAVPKKEILSEICKVGIPASIQNLLNVAGMTILNNFTAVYGSAAVSAMGISHKVILLPLYVSMGIANGSNPLVAYNYGSKNYKRSKDCVSFSAILGIAVSLVFMFAFFFFPGQITGAFLKDSETVAYGAVFLRSMCLCMPFLAMDFIGVGVYQAFGKGTLALLFAVGRKLVLEIPFLFILNKLHPLYGLAWAQTCAEFILGTAAVIVIRNIFKKLGV